MAINKEKLDKALIERALSSVQGHLQSLGKDEALEIIETQLKWLLKFVNGKTFTNSKLKEVAVGVLAMREVESLDSTLAKQLYEIQYVVDQIK